MTRRGPIGRELLWLSRRAKRVLAPAALGRVAAFVESCRAAEGGYRGRGGEGGDVYYTLFGAVAGSIAGADSQRRALCRFLDRQSPAVLDLPHLAALVQCQRLCHPLGIPRRCHDTYMHRVAGFRSPDGGFAEAPGSPRGSAYALYLALLCYEALGAALPAPEQAAAAATGLLEDELAGGRGGLHRTVAAVLAHQALGGAVPVVRVRAYLDACGDAAGGFRAHRQAPQGDLLSTAVAGFVLWRMGAPLRGPAATRTAQFVQSLWDVSGGFRGSALDPTPDCEYTFYGLLALGGLEP